MTTYAPTSFGRSSLPTALPCTFAYKLITFVVIYPKDWLTMSARGSMFNGLCMYHVLSSFEGSALGFGARPSASDCFSSPSLSVAKSLSASPWLDSRNFLPVVLLKRESSIYLRKLWSTVTPLDTCS